MNKKFYKAVAFALLLSFGSNSLMYSTTVKASDEIQSTVQEFPEGSALYENEYTEPGLKESTILSDISINSPFRIGEESARLFYRVSRSIEGTIKVYDSNGAEVQTIYDNVPHEEMYYQISWDGKNNSGQYVQPGNYEIRLKFGDDEQSINVQAIDDFELSNISVDPKEISRGEYVKLYYNVNKQVYGDIDVYTENGVKVQTLYDHVIHSPGYYRIDWDGKDSEGNYVAPGKYILRLQFAGQTQQIAVSVKESKVLSDITVNSPIRAGGESAELFYRVSQPVKGTIKVYDSNGAEVQTIYDNVLHKPMYYRVSWDGKNNNGQYVQPGNYEIRLKFGTDEESKQVEVIDDFELSKISVSTKEIRHGETVELYYNVNKQVYGDIAVYTENGVKVQTLYDHVIHSPGYYRIDWDGMDSKGNYVAPGKYIIRLKFEGHSKEISVNVKETEILSDISVNSPIQLSEQNAKLFYRVNIPTKGTIEVYDTNGKKIQTLYDNVPHEKMYYTISWDGKDDYGHYVLPGDYEIRLQFGDELQSVAVKVIDDLKLSDVHLTSQNVVLGDPVEIYYNVDRPVSGNIAVFNSDDQKVKDLYIDIFHNAGYYKINWDGTDNDNKPVSYGKYVIKLDFRSSHAELNCNIVEPPLVTNVTGNPNAGLASGNVTVFYKINKQCNVDLNVVDASGNIVYTIYDNYPHQPGDYRAFWDAKDFEGKQVPEGTYTFKFTARNTEKESEAEFEVKLNKCIVWIDAGHGGTDCGATKFGRYERDDNLKLALEVQRVLEEQGVVVMMSRIDDDPSYNANNLASLGERVDKANSVKADVFVSLHRDSASAAARGFTVYTHNDSSQNYNPNAYPNKNSGCYELANALNSEIADVGGFRSRGVIYGSAAGDQDLYVNKHTNMPSCLLEMGFVTNQNDNAIFDAYLTQNAIAIAKGIMSYLNIPYI